MGFLGQSVYNFPQTLLFKNKPDHLNQKGINGKEVLLIFFQP